MDDKAIHVSVRVRPYSEPGQSPFEINDNAISFKHNHTYFSFDKIFKAQDNNEMVYNHFAKGIIHNAMLGVNGTIFAYGQTGSGKTHTMYGDNVDEIGVIMHAVTDIFKFISKSQNSKIFMLRVSFMEIYNEQIHDLLSDTPKRDLKVHENGKREFFVAELADVVVVSAADTELILRKGNANRHIGETNMNESSSRSHTIFKVYIESSEQDVEGAVTQSCLNLVDLAGSERVGHTGAEGIRLKEGSLINKSLLALGTVINKLSDGGGHIPYRDSKLTLLLKQSLGGNANTAIICNITPAASFCDDTISTLKFASRAKKIQNKPEVNLVLDKETIIKNYESYVKILEAELKESRKSSVSIADPSNIKKEEMARYLKGALLNCENVDKIDDAEDRKKRIVRRQTWFAAGRRSLTQEHLLDEDTKHMSTFSTPQKKDIPEYSLRKVPLISSATHNTHQSMLSMYAKLQEDQDFSNIERASLHQNNEMLSRQNDKMALDMELLQQTRSALLEESAASVANRTNDNHSHCQKIALLEQELATSKAQLNRILSKVRVESCAQTDLAFDLEILALKKEVSELNKVYADAATRNAADSLRFENAATEICAFEDWIATLSLEKNNVAVELSNERDANRAALEELTCLKKSAGAWQEEQNKLQARLDEEHQRTKVMSLANEQLETSVAALEVDLTKEQDGFFEAIEAHRSVKEDVARLEAQVKRLGLLNGELELRGTEGCEEVKELNRRLVSSQGDLGALSARNFSLLEQNADEARRSALLAETIASIERQMESVMNDKDERESAVIVELRATLKEMEATILSERNQSGDYTLQVARGEAMYLEAKGLCAEREAMLLVKVDSAAQEAEEAGIQRVELERVNAQLQLEFEKVELVVREYQVSADNFSVAMDRQNSEKKTLQSQVDEIQLELEQRDSVVLLLNSRTAEVEELLAQKSDALEITEENLLTLRTELQEIQERVGVDSDKATDASEKLADLVAFHEDQIKTMLAENATLEVSVAEHINGNTLLASKISTLNSELSTSRMETRNVLDSEESLGEECRNAAMKNQVLSSELGDIKTGLSKSQDDVRDWTGKYNLHVKTTESSIATLSKDVSSKVEQILEFEKDLLLANQLKEKSESIIVALRAENLALAHEKLKNDEKVPLNGNPSDSADLERRIKSLENQLRFKQDEYSRITSDLELQAAEHMDELLRLQAENDQFIQTTTDQDFSAQRSQDEIRHLRGKLEETSDDCDELQKELFDRSTVDSEMIRDINSQLSDERLQINELRKIIQSKDEALNTQIAFTQREKEKLERVLKAEAKSICDNFVLERDEKFAVKDARITSLEMRLHTLNNASMAPQPLSASKMSKLSADLIGCIRLISRSFGIESDISKQDATTKDPEILLDEVTRTTTELSTDGMQQARLLLKLNTFNAEKSSWNVLKKAGEFELKQRLIRIEQLTREVESLKKVAKNLPIGKENEKKEHTRHRKEKVHNQECTQQ